VLNWEKRISDYSEATKAKYQYAFEREAELKELLNDKSDDWKVYIDKPKEDIFCEARTSSRNNP